MIEFHLNDKYRDLPKNWPEYHDGEQIDDIKVYKDSKWTVVTNGFCQIQRPALLVGNYPDQGPVIDLNKEGKEDWNRYLTILDAEKIHLRFEHNSGIGEGFTAKLSKDEAREIGEALVAASLIDDINEDDGQLQSFNRLIGAPRWINELYNNNKL